VIDMSKHIQTVSIPASEFDRVNRLLAIESLEDLSDEELGKRKAGMKRAEGIYEVIFDDGSSLNFDLCSGSNNYWDDVVWTSPDGSTDIPLDCQYELGDIEFEVNSELYVVHVMEK